MSIQVDLVICEKNRLAYNKFANKKTKDDCKLEDRFQKKAISGLHICEIADKKTAYNECHLYSCSVHLSRKTVMPCLETQ